MPILNLLDLNTDKLLDKYKEKFKKDKSFFKNLKERVNQFENEKHSKRLSIIKK